MELQKIKSDNLYVLQLDVTSDESVDKAVQFIKLHSEGCYICSGIHNKIIFFLNIASLIKISTIEYLT